MSAERELLKRLVAAYDSEALWNELDPLINEAEKLLAQSPECCPTCSAVKMKWQWRMETGGWQDCSVMLAGIFAANGSEVRQVPVKTSLAEEGEKA